MYGSHTSGLVYMPAEDGVTERDFRKHGAQKPVSAST